MLSSRAANQRPGSPTRPSETYSSSNFPSCPRPQQRALDAALFRTEVEGSPPDQRAVSLATLAVLRALAGSSPVIIAIDDIQWLDAASVRVLSFAARRLRDEPIRVPGGDAHRFRRRPARPGSDDGIRPAPAASRSPRRGDDDPSPQRSRRRRPRAPHPAPAAHGLAGEPVLRPGDRAGPRQPSGPAGARRAVARSRGPSASYWGRGSTRFRRAPPTRSSSSRRPPGPPSSWSLRRAPGYGSSAWPGSAEAEEADIIAAQRRADRIHTSAPGIHRLRRGLDGDPTRPSIAAWRSWSSTRRSERDTSPSRHGGPDAQVAEALDAAAPARLRTGSSRRRPPSSPSWPGSSHRPRTPQASSSGASMRPSITSMRATRSRASRCWRRRSRWGSPVPTAPASCSSWPRSVGSTSAASRRLCEQALEEAEGEPALSRRSSNTSHGWASTVAILPSPRAREGFDASMHVGSPTSRSEADVVVHLRHGRVPVGSAGARTSCPRRCGCKTWR